MRRSLNQPPISHTHPSQPPPAVAAKHVPSIYYFAEDIDFSLPQPAATAQYLQRLIQQEGYTLNHLNFIFCSDRYLHQKNIQYLQHDTFTDVITFDYSNAPNRVEGDIYVSVDRVRENAQAYQHTWMQELYTVMVHGLLHLLGYDDKDPTAQAHMRHKEATHLAPLATLLGRHWT